MFLWLGSLFGGAAAGLMAIMIVVIIFSIGADRKKRTDKKLKLPPGPNGVPILGTFPSFLKSPAHIVLQEWTEKFGNVYKFTLGSGTSVVLGDVSTIREVFVKNSPDVDSRCQWRTCFLQTFRGLSTLPFSSKWKSTRRRTLTILKNLGMGRAKMEQKILQESENLATSLIAEGVDGKKNFDPENMLRKSSMKVLYKVIFGERFDVEHPDVTFMLETILYVFNFLAKASIYDILPDKVRKLTGFSLKPFHNRLDKLNRIIREKVKEHKSEYNRKTEASFVQSWLKASEDEMMNTRESSEDTSACSDLPDVLQDIAIAGGHTTGVVYRWAVLLLAIHKPIQDRAHVEIVAAIGPDGHPTMADRPKLRYIEAIIHEVLRIACVLPLIAHATWKDTKIRGFDVPEGTEVMYNAWSLNRNEEAFPEPNTFNPDRWLRDGEIRKELFHVFFPFGIGKRSCVGEAFARMNLFITIATLLHEVEFLLPDERVDERFTPKQEHEFGLLADCKSYMIRTRTRAMLT